MLRTCVALLAIVMCCRAEAQVPRPPLSFFGAAGSPDLFITLGGGGTQFVFEYSGGPTLASVQAFEATIASGAVDMGGETVDQVTFRTFQGRLSQPTSATAAVYSGKLEYLFGGTGDVYVVIFTDVEHLETYLYYAHLAQSSRTYPDIVYGWGLAGYALGIGVEDEGLALYNYYNSLGDYWYVVLADKYPQWAGYYYWYYHGLGAYYYYERHGDLNSAQLAFAYHLGLANGFL